MTDTQTHRQLLSEQDYEKAPFSCRDGLRIYIEYRVPAGHFLTAFMANDLMEAIGRADDYNRDQIVKLASWVYCYAPADCHGSYEAVRRWLAKGGA